jgi:DNA polymerase III epsilon subunit-like protein
MMAMSFVMVDVESDGTIPGDYSMICFGAVVVDDTLEKTFYARLRPISDKWVPEALAVSGFTREQTLQFDSPQPGMQAFRAWREANASGRLMFISDNNGYDWQFINWYSSWRVSWVPPSSICCWG